MTTNSVRQIAADLRAGNRDATDVVRQTLARAEAARGLNAFIAIDPERALERAAAVDAVAPAQRGTLAGVPVAMKDNLMVAGHTATCSSRILSGYRAFYDAHVTSLLYGEGAIPFGRANMDEFAMGSSGENSANGPAGNPWGDGLVPGGSSSGSAAAVAAGIVPAALGSDTGGSIRQPASFCGIVGMKPTYGRVSRRGLVAFASSLDQIGPFGRTVDDAALLYDAIVGHDPLDATSVAEPIEPCAKPDAIGVAGLRVGVPAEYFGAGLDPEIEAMTRDAIAKLEAAGAKVVPISLPATPHAVATYYVIACAEASSNLARFDGVRFGHRTADAHSIRDLYARSRAEGFGPEVRRRIILGTYVLSAGYFDAYYVKAQRVRTLFVRDFEAAFERCDVIVAPSSPTAPFKRGDRTDDPLAMYMADVYTIPANLAGLPAISVPTGLNRDGLPVGLQFLAAPFAESMLFRFAYTWEALRGALPDAPGMVAAGGSR